MIRVILPAHLRSLARSNSDEVELSVDGEISLRTVLDKLEETYPMLCGTVREHVTKKRRDYVRIFACEEDWSHRSQDDILPGAIATGKEPLYIIGAISGGQQMDTLK